MNDTMRAMKVAAGTAKLKLRNEALERIKDQAKELVERVDSMATHLEGFDGPLKSCGRGFWLAHVVKCRTLLAVVKNQEEA